MIVDNAGQYPNLYYGTKEDCFTRVGDGDTRRQPVLGMEK